MQCQQHPLQQNTLGVLYIWNSQLWHFSAGHASGGRFRQIAFDNCPQWLPNGSGQNRMLDAPHMEVLCKGTGLLTQKFRFLRVLELRLHHDPRTHDLELRHAGPQHMFLDVVLGRVHAQVGRAQKHLVWLDPGIELQQGLMSDRSNLPNAISEWEHTRTNSVG